jgi:hypothetical protein
MDVLVTENVFYGREAQVGAWAAGLSSSDGCLYRVWVP